MNIHYDVTGLLTGMEVTLRSDCLACRSWAGKRGVLYSKHIYVISRSLPVADYWIDEDAYSEPLFFFHIAYTSALVCNMRVGLYTACATLCFHFLMMSPMGTFRSMCYWCRP